MAYIKFDSFEGRRDGVTLANKIVVNGGIDSSFAVNANQIDWGKAFFLNSYLETSTTQEVLEKIEDIQITYYNVWEVVGETYEGENTTPPDNEQP